MNILWVTNVPLPEYSQITQSNEIPYGGWLINTSIEVSRKADINLSVAFPIDEKVDLESSVSGEKINYHPFQTIRGDKELTKESLDRIKYILNIVKPDIVHLHGTESRHTYEFTKLCKELGVKTVISIQGLVSVIAKHMRANLPDSVYYGKTIRDWLRKASIYDLTNTYTKKGAYEIEALKLTNNVIGRTSWDKSNSLLINSNINYHHCNESLRDFFYKFDLSN